MSFWDGSNPKGGPRRGNLETKEGGPFNFFIMYATADGHAALDGDEDGNGTFTKLLLTHMEMDGNIEDVSKAILNDLVSSNGGTQVWMASLLTDRLCWRWDPAAHIGF